ncbi:DAK2 domain-containing protein [Actinocorallia longicatena]|uniref:DAK2 domain-containing protein n=1 Tax=Actinocorallia longicatena TaxID=111803 RepID=A0ABP6PZI6_9ACTN
MLDELDAAAVRRWVRAAADALGDNRREIDVLNVFPVPDGDTGTNLHLTVLAAAERVEELPAGAVAREVWQALAQGALLGARGNSGVIVSQVLRALAEMMGGERADGNVLEDALAYAAELARAAVAHPVEGTILTVLSAASEAATGDSLGAVARTAARGARLALRKTPEQMDLLSRSGVVDAGAAGLCVLLDALCAVVTEEFPEHYDVPSRAETGAVTRLPRPEQHKDHGYEVMFLLETDDGSIPELRRALDALGDSLVIVGGDGLWNVHVHVDDAGAAIEAGLVAGRAYRIRVTYLAVANTPQPPCTGRGVVAVTAADGLAALFEGAGATVVRRRSGGMPPLAVLVEAILLAGDEVAVLPNEPEVLALVEAAAARARDSGVRIAVIPTRASVQGLAALAVHDPLRRFHDDVIAMAGTARATRFGSLVIATEEAMTSAGICQPGDVLGLIEGDVVMIGSQMSEVTRQVLARMLSGGGELVTLVTGVGVPSGLVAEVEGELRAQRPDVELTVYDGGQVLYPILLGVE